MKTGFHDRKKNTTQLPTDVKNVPYDPTIGIKMIQGYLKKYNPELLSAPLSIPQTVSGQIKSDIFFRGNEKPL